MRLHTLAALVLGFAGSALCCFAEVDPGLLALVPPDSQLVIGANVVASRNSDLGQYLSSQFQSSDKGLERFIAETGFDPKRDLDSVVFAGRAGASGKQNTAGLLLVRGTFDQARIRNAALAKGVGIENFSGVEVFLPGNERGGNAFAFLRTDVFVTGSLADLQQVVARRSTVRALDPQLRQLIATAGSENDIWFASTAPVSRLASRLQPELSGPMAGSQSLEAVTSASGGLKFGSSVEVMLDAVARSEKDASALADVVRFGASMLQMRGQSDSKSIQLVTALTQMLVSVNGRNLHVSLSLPETMLEQFAAIRERRHIRR
jgi:hypothetical protein